MPKKIIKVLEFSSEEQERATIYADKVIDLLKPLPKKLKWLVIKSLYEGFPREEIEVE
jgi:hypothetical protein